jgi:hypothetical protein
MVWSERPVDAASSIGPFEPIADVLARVAEDRFADLERLAARHVADIQWRDRLEPLRLTPDDLRAAIATQRWDDVDGLTVFAPFEGRWMGGGLHDNRRAYQHIWDPARPEEDKIVQRVLMEPLGGGDRTIAYNCCLAASDTGGCRIRGIVDGWPCVGYPLPREGLLWIGALEGGQLSVHAERVVADGQLYDVRGWVLRQVGSQLEYVAQSDWRYHRVSDSAVKVRTLQSPTPGSFDPLR